MRIRWSVRRFFCDHVECKRRVFAEHIDELADRHAQATPRFGLSLVRIGMESGGAPGARLAIKQGTITSGSTILRRLRTTSVRSAPAPVVIGVDDFALRRGQVYGTLFVDHQTHHVIDLIPERSSESATRWLAGHESISIVTRDRSSLYAKGIRDAHPEAIQIADRWHLLSNARDALIRLLDRHHREINTAQKTVAEEVALTPNPSATPIESAPATIVIEAPATPVSKARQDSLHRRERRLLRYRQVLALREQKTGIRAIGRQFGMSRNTVLRFLGAKEFPEHAKRHTHKEIDAFAKRLREWWDGGVHNARDLHRRVKALGFTGSWYCVRRLVAPWRDPQEKCSGAKSPIRARARYVPRISSKRLSWLLIKDDIPRKGDEAAVIARLRSEVPAIDRAVDLMRVFGTAVKERSREKLTAWMKCASEPASPAEMQSFATGLQQDWPGVVAAMDYAWSNGRTEGHVNRIKMIKRKMYGRAKFDLLRIRVLASGP